MNGIPERTLNIDTRERINVDMQSICASETLKCVVFRDTILIFQHFIQVIGLQKATDWGERK